MASTREPPEPAADYQLVEREDVSLPAVELVVSPRVGDLDAAEVAKATLAFLSGPGGAQRMMAERWCQAGTLRVVQREPHSGRSAKILPLQLLRDHH